MLVAIVSGCRSDAKTGFNATIPEHGPERSLRLLNTTTHSAFGGKYSQFEHNKIHDVDTDELQTSQQDAAGVSPHLCLHCLVRAP